MNDKSILQIWQDFIRGNRNAFIALWQKLEPSVLRQMSCACGDTPALDPEAAEELTRQVMEKLYMRAGQFQPRENSTLLGWVWVLGLNQKRDWLKRNRRKNQSSLDESDSGRPLTSVLTGSKQEKPGDAMDRQRASALVQHLRQTLNEEENVLLELRVVERKDFKTIAEELDGNDKNWEMHKKRFYRLCEKLKKEMEQYGKPEDFLDD